MSCSFYVVDDDRSVRKMLSAIIQTHFSVQEVGQCDDPWFSVQDILRKYPDIVILDLLMDEMDGIEVAEKLRLSGFRGKIVMLSEVTSKEMIAKAYASGVDDYISKPINVTEVVKVLQRTIEHLQLQTYVRLMTTQSNGDSGKTTPDSTLFKKRIHHIYRDLGIISEAGTEELCLLLFELSTPVTLEINANSTLHQYYLWLQTHYPPYKLEGISIKGIEQRLRRIVQTAMANLAFMGIEDFSNYKFEKYSTTLFNFITIKAEMDYLRGKLDARGKVDVKRFIDGILTLIE